MRRTIAIDFDGCLCESAWPDIGAPNWPVIRAALAEQRRGTALILWTCRWGDSLAAAVQWCREHGLEFDAVNSDLPERLELFGGGSRKVSADEYWDDRAVHMAARADLPLTLEQLREMDGEPVWCESEHRPDGSGWFLVDASASQPLEFVAIGRERGIPCAGIDTGYWLAYRRKPEEGTA